MSKLKAEDKPFEISKWLVWDAYKKVKANKGAPGVDGQAIEQFEQDLEDNLYRLWNRLSSGTYFPPPVKAVEIPKPGGRGVRVLGIPSVSDRIAQTAAAMVLERKVVKGHRFLPTRGHETCPLVATVSAYRWPRNCRPGCGERGQGPRWVVTGWGITAWLWVITAWASRSVTATGSSQCGHGPPTPIRRVKVRQVSQRCSPSCRSPQPGPIRRR